MNRLTALSDWDRALKSFKPKVLKEVTKLFSLRVKSRGGNKIGFSSLRRLQELNDKSSTDSNKSENFLLWYIIWIYACPPNPEKWLRSIPKD